MSTQVKMRFTVKEDGNGRPYIVMEPSDKKAPVEVSFRLRLETTLGDATALSSVLNNSVEAVRFE